MMHVPSGFLSICQNHNYIDIPSLTLIPYVSDFTILQYNARYNTQLVI